jgi:hypothetical protein
MNAITLNNTTVTTVVFLAALFGSISVASAAFSPAPSATLFSPKAKESLATKRQILDEKHQQIEYEAISALTGTQNALMALKKDDRKLAIALLKEATKQLNMLLAKYPHSNLIPALVDADLYEFDSDTNQVEKLLNTANELLEDHRVQAARQLLDQLVSEIHVTTISVPLGSFSMGVNDAASFASGGNIAKAKDVLNEVLNRLVKTVQITPIPMLQAADLLTDATKLAQAGDRPKEARKAQILALFDAAKEKLKFAEMLGYGTKGDYEEAYDAIDEIKNVDFIDKPGNAWNKITTAISDLTDKLTRLKK